MKKSPTGSYPLPVTLNMVLFTYTFSTVILFWVSVPVLSVQMILVEPRVSTEGSFLTRACLLTILLTPRASPTVTTAGRASGIAATASATPQRNISKGSKPLKIPSTATKATTIRVAAPSQRPNWSSFSCKGVLSLSISPRRPASFPKAVLMPVAVITAFPLP